MLAPIMHAAIVYVLDTGPGRHPSRVRIPKSIALCYPLPGALIVESPLFEIEFDALRIGLPVELTSFPLYYDEDGTAVLMFAFTMRRTPSA
jgi:hypothetical protein